MSLFKQITDKPWERKGIIGGLKPEGTFKSPAERVALNFFLVAASIVFSLFGVSYYIRMELPDWLPIAEPTSLWFNTGLLVLSSVLFQWARNVVGNGGSKNVKLAFFGGGVFAILFIAAQLQTWEELQLAGVYLSSNPAADFYFLLTGLHAIHIAGGLYVWIKCVIRMVTGAEAKEQRLSIELCTVYWHFLLVVWLVIFAVVANT